MNLEEFSKKEYIAISQFISTAVSEKLSALKSYDYLEERSKKGTAKFLKEALAQVSDVK
ncbi:MAG: hypothetical protein L3J10_02165 [Sulfurimonas sp.]|nr:hypothetical protein [Sulfurimonas sp.]